MVAAAATTTTTTHQGQQPNDGDNNATEQQQQQQQQQEREEEEESSSLEGLAEWMALSQDIATALDVKTQMRHYWQTGSMAASSSSSRADGRTWAAVRPTTVIPDIFSTTTTSSSALVRLGDTHVTAAVTWQMGQTSTTATTTTTTGRRTTVEQGDLWVHMESTDHGKQQQPSSSSSSQYSILATWIQRILHETLGNHGNHGNNTTTTTNNNNNNNDSAWTQLSIRPGWAWRAVVSCVVLHDAGNVRDAALLATVAALQRAPIPNTTTTMDPWVDRRDKFDMLHMNKNKNSNNNNKSDNDKDTTTTKTKLFQMPVIPIALTIGQWQAPLRNNNNNNNNNTTAAVLQQQQQQSTTKWWVDPTAREELALDGSMTLVVTLPQGSLWGMEFQGACTTKALDWTTTHLPLLQRLAAERAKELQEILLSSSS